MTITKSTSVAGLYNCTGYVNGTFFSGSGWTTTEALEECFHKVMWVN